LRRAADLDSHNARYAYIYGVALHSAGRRQEAIIYLKDSLAGHPENRDIVLALISFSREAGDAATALQFAEQAIKIAPDDLTVKSLVEALRRQTSPR
jgi:tetratricopeptide (TPR) repeat protein